MQGLLGMDNQEIADLFTTKIPENEPKDLYDRFLNLAIYLNETTKEDSYDTLEGIVQDLSNLLDQAYDLERT
jgi:hypothetical protein